MLRPYRHLCAISSSHMKSDLATLPLLAILLLGAPGARLAAQHFHRLPATPRTVAYGYYSAAATAVLRIASGDTVEVETLITNRPDRLEAAGVAPYRGWSKMEAYRLVSAACDVRVTELVDGNVGVHVMIPKSIVGK